MPEGSKKGVKKEEEKIKKKDAGPSKSPSNVNATAGKGPAFTLDRKLDEAREEARRAKEELASFKGHLAALYSTPTSTAAGASKDDDDDDSDSERSGGGVGVGRAAGGVGSAGTGGGLSRHGRHLFRLVDVKPLSPGFEEGPFDGVIIHDTLKIDGIRNCNVLFEDGMQYTYTLDELLPCVVLPRPGIISAEAVVKTVNRILTKGIPAISDSALAYQISQEDKAKRSTPRKTPSKDAAAGGSAKKKRKL